MTIERFDIAYTDGVVCPFCGHAINDDLYDYRESGTLDCEECGKAFTFSANHKVTYSTQCVEHEYGEWDKRFHYNARFCQRCGKCDLKPIGKPI